MHSISLGRLARRAFIALGMLTTIVGAARAQGTVEGKVTATAGTPLSDVIVFVTGSRRGAATDASGKYRIQGVPAGTQQIVAQRVGYKPDTASAAVTDGATATADFKLTEGAALVAPVTVTATRELQRRSEGSLTIDGVSGTDVRVTRASHPADILNRIAGVHVSQLSGEGHSMAIRQPISTNPLYLYLEDGVPTRATGFFNHNALYEVNLPQSAGIEVIKGPGTALYGSDAIGGIVNSLTRAAPLSPTIESSLEGGDHGYRRLLVTGGNTWGGHGLRADVNVTHSDNWKQDAPFDRVSGTLRWDGSFGAGWSSKTVLTGSRIDQQDVPALQAKVFDTATTVNLAPIAFRSVRALRMSSAIEKSAGKSLVSITPYVRVNEMGLLPSWQLTYDPQVWDTRSKSVGFLARVRRDVTYFDGQIIVGVDGDVSPGSFKANRAVVTRTGAYNAFTSYTDGAQHYDYDVTSRAVSPYVQTQWTITPRLRVDAGVRGDFTGYEYTTNLAPMDTGAHRRPANTSVSYAHLSPKLGATYEISRMASVYAAYRHGFRAPSQGQLFQQNSAANSVGLEPVKVDNYEVGVRGQVGARFIYQVAAYDMIKKDDILTFVTSQNTREATNAGSSRHRGIEVSTGAAFTPTLRLDVAYSAASHRYVDWTPSASTTSPVSYSGKLQEQAPRDLADVMLTWSPRALNTGRVSVQWSHLGRYAEDPANTAFYGGYEVVNVNTNYFVTPRIEAFARVMNAANRRFAEVASFDTFQKDLYTPGAPRSLVMGLRYAY